MKVYIVTSGEYSDYCIRKVFLDKEKADKCAELANRIGAAYDDCRVEEYETSDDIFHEPAYVRCGYFLYPYSGMDNAYVDDEFVNADSVVPDYMDDDTFFFYLREDSRAFESRDILKQVARDRYAAYKAKKEGIA